MMRKQLEILLQFLRFIIHPLCTRRRREVFIYMTRGTVRMRDEVRLGRRRKRGEDGKKGADEDAFLRFINHPY